ncbi:phosphopantetheine-binding protein [Streptomyces sp. NBC_00638]|uniref:phosphopantetheine-binding protein n=1 Tax=unclassified Streptomyces TaxID=2593676 RepID=UPI00225760BE|nr:phosphopantetheine-binding protein [Streptomyces sp. NBC_00638]MCX5001125.1 phosphopantetheine-binding protein [Streptomyces sp. NBC_00638]
MELAAVMEEIDGYIRKEFLDGDASVELTPTSPLLEWGILNSMNTTRLAAFVSERYDVTVSPKAMRTENFRTIERVAHMVLELRDRPAV